MFAEGCEGECGVKNMECFAAGRNEGYTTRKQCIFYKKLLDAGMTQSKNDYFPRCQMSRSYSAMVRSEENMPALAMFTKHLRRQPFGSQA